MVADLDDREFAEMLAAIWEHHGWTTEVTDQGGEIMVAGDRPDGRRGLILVAPGDSGPVGKDRLETLQTLQTEKEIDIPVAATRSSFDDAAREMADMNGLFLVDPETLEETASAQGFEDLLKQYSRGGIVRRLLRAVSLPRLNAIPRPSRAIPSVGAGGNTRLLIAVAVVVVVIAMLAGGKFGEGAGGLLAGLPIPDFGLFDAIGGFLGSLPIPDFGIFDALGGLLAGLPIPDLGFGGGGYSVTAVSLTQGDATPMEVEWDARRQSEVVGPNGTAFEPPENHTFVAVQLNASNPTADTVVLEPDAFAFATGQHRYGPQLLQNARGQLPIVVPPISSSAGYLVFTVPADSTSGTLLALPGPEAIPIEFERDTSLEYQVKTG